MLFLFFLIVGVVAVLLFRSSRKKFIVERNVMYRTSTTASGAVALGAAW